MGKKLDYVPFNANQHVKVELAYCCFWCHSVGGLKKQLSTGRIHCTSCSVNPVLTKWKNSCPRIHEVSEPYEIKGD